MIMMVQKKPKRSVSIIFDHLRDRLLSVLPDRDQGFDETLAPYQVTFGRRAAVDQSDVGSFPTQMFRGVNQGSASSGHRKTEAYHQRVIDPRKNFSHRFG